MQNSLYTNTAVNTFTNHRFGSEKSLQRASRMHEKRCAT